MGTKHTLKNGIVYKIKLKKILIANGALCHVFKSNVKYDMIGDDNELISCKLDYFHILHEREFKNNVQLNFTSILSQC